MEQQYVLRNTPRIEPQGEEDFAESPSVGTENSSKAEDPSEYIEHMNNSNVTIFRSLWLRKSIVIE